MCGLAHSRAASGVRARRPPRGDAAEARALKSAQHKAKLLEAELEVAGFAVLRARAEAALAENVARTDAARSKMELEQAAEALEAKKTTDAAKDKAEREALEAKRAADAAKDKAEREALEAKRAADAAKDKAEREALEAKRAADAAKDKAECEALDAKRATDAAKDKAEREALEAKWAADVAKDKAEAEAREAKAVADAARFKREEAAAVLELRAIALRAARPFLPGYLGSLRLQRWRLTTTCTSLGLTLGAACCLGCASARCPHHRCLRPAACCQWHKSP